MTTRGRKGCEIQSTISTVTNLTTCTNADLPAREVVSVDSEPWLRCMQGTFDRRKTRGDVEMNDGVPTKGNYGETAKAWGVRGGSLGGQETQNW